MKILHVFSGGMDSTVLLYQLLEQKHEVQCVNFQYGSKHNEQECSAAAEICKHLNIPFTIIDLPINAYFKSSLLQTGKEIPEGHYAAPTMKSTVVPFRNGIMLSFAIGLAESRELEAVSIGAHTGDHHIYPDCRPGFIRSISRAAEYGTYAQIRVFAPFMDMTKTDIARLGEELGVPFELTWTCYKGGIIHCGACGACNERKEAFRDAGVPDVTIYAQ